MEQINKLKNTGKNRIAGQFKPGQSGNPAGKPKGAEAKTTKEAKELFVLTLENQVSNIQTAFAEVFKTDKVKYLELFAKYAQYFVPKKTDMTIEEDKVIYVNGPVRKEEIKKIVEKLKEEY